VTAAANSAAPERSAATLRQPAASRKAERARTSDNITATVTNTTDTSNGTAARPAIEKRNFAEASKTQTDKKPIVIRSATQAEKKQALTAKSPNISSRDQGPLRPVPHKELRRIGAPSRLPNPELRDNTPAP
jgi:hypothetical protein